MKYEHLISRMTLEEKASLMSGADWWHTKPVERLGIPSMAVSDGPHGLRKQPDRADPLGIHPAEPATCYPTASGLANTWDEALLEEVGQCLGLEAVSKDVSVVLGPGCNIKRSPLCGRNFEYFSEDPHLSGKMAAALIRGIQSNGIAACVKHFAANSQELRRMTNDSLVDERTLREIYLPAFEMAVKEGGVKCLMTSYNRLNGTYTHENPHLLREILYGDWGYGGMVVSDWGGNNDRVASVRAGGTLEMPSSHGQTDRQLVRAVRAGELEEALLDEQADRLLDTVFSARAGLDGRTFDPVAHHAMAGRAAEECAVLLKNEDRILPLGGESVAVIGDFARLPRYQGAGSSKINPTMLANGLDALKAAGVNIAGFARGFRRSGAADGLLLRQACILAAKADKVLLWLGLNEGGEAENVDRTDMRLPENQVALLKAVAKVNPNIAVILSCGCALEMEWDVHAKAVLHGYLGGQNGASAIARLVTGRVSPSGKLSETVPHHYADMPSAPWFPGRGAYAQYREGIYVGYRYFDTAQRSVKYPFGHGLSYTEYEYSGLEVSESAVRFKVKNVGTCPGAEVAQLYISAKTGGIFRPAQELKGFARVMLEPGQEREVEIPVSDRSFAVWSILADDWVVEPGEYELRIGASSRDIRLVATVTKSGPAIENPYVDPIFEPYYRADVRHISDEAFEALLGRPVPGEDAASVGFNDPLTKGEALGGVGRLLCGAVRLLRVGFWRLGLREMSNNMVFVLEMPWRNIARMSGVLGDEQVLALLEVVNRRPGGWKKFLGSLKGGTV